MRRYPSYVSPTAEPPAPTIEAKRQAPGEREPVHVRASVMEHLAVGMSWAFVVGAVAIGVWAVLYTEITFWPAAGVTMLFVFAVVTCYMITWHYTQDEQLRGRDLRAWRDLEADYVALEIEHAKALGEVKYVRGELKQYEAKRITHGPKRAPNATEKAAQEAQEKYERTVREIATRHDLGLPYTRERMVQEEVTTPALWDRIMNELREVHLAEPRGRGGRMVVTAFRGEDILRTLQVPR